jgi:hypothetical protein
MKKESKNKKEPICKQCNQEITPDEHKRNGEYCDICLWAEGHN